MILIAVCIWYREFILNFAAHFQHLSSEYSHGWPAFGNLKLGTYIYVDVQFVATAKGISQNIILTD